MSEPRTDHENLLHAAILENISGGSALHMFPEPIPKDQQDERGYLVDVDHMVAHAYAHYNAATQLLGKLEQKISRFLADLRRIGYDLEKLDHPQAKTLADRLFTLHDGFTC